MVGSVVFLFSQGMLGCACSIACVCVVSRKKNLWRFNSRLAAWSILNTTRLIFLDMFFLIALFCHNQPAHWVGLLPILTPTLIYDDLILQASKLLKIKSVEKKNSSINSAQWNLKAPFCPCCSALALLVPTGGVWGRIPELHQAGRHLHRGRGPAQTGQVTAGKSDVCVWVCVCVCVCVLSLTVSCCCVPSPVGGIGHALRALQAERRQAELQAAARHQLPLQGGLHRARHLPGHHGVTAAGPLVPLGAVLPLCQKLLPPHLFHGPSAYNIYKLRLGL